MRTSHESQNLREGRPHLRSLIVALLALALLGPLAAAQGMLEGAVRIGVIVPPVDEPDLDRLENGVRQSALDGAEMAVDEFEFNAEMLDIDLKILTSFAAGPTAVVAAAEDLVEQGAYGVIGGFTTAEALALADWSATAGVPYINIGADADSLRGQQCQATAYHLVPSAGMYLDSLAGWYVRAGFRDWFIVYGDDDESAAQKARLERGLTERHFGARVVGSTEVTAGGAGAEAADVLADVQRAKATLVVLLTPAADQLELLAVLDAGGLEAEVAGYPYLGTQTRAYLQEQVRVAPRLGTQRRSLAWEAGLDAYGAREINARYRAAYRGPMETPAWATYQGVKVLYEAAFFSGATDPDTIFGYLDDAGSVFDVWKGIGTSFRPWDHQLRQPLYLVKVEADATAGVDGANLVGELPAIYMPGTDPVERLDQLGDLANDTACKF